MNVNPVERCFEVSSCAGVL